jgi:hypothetical protein
MKLVGFFLPTLLFLGVEWYVCCLLVSVDEDVRIGGTLSVLRRTSLGGSLSLASFARLGADQNVGVAVA